MKKVTLTEMKKKKEIERQEAIKRWLGCTFIRINRDAENYYIFVEISNSQKHIIESTKKLTKKSTKKSLIDDLLKRILSFNKIKVFIKWIVKKILPSV